MVERFTIYNLLQKKRTEDEEQKRLQNKKYFSEKSINRSSEALSDALSISLISFGNYGHLKFYLGFTLEQVVEAHKIYKFETLDHAVQLLMKCPVTGSIEHSFVELIPYSLTCKLCNYSKAEHRVEDKKEDNKDDDQMFFGANETLKQEVGHKSLEPKKFIAQKTIEFTKEILEEYENPNLCYICWSNKVDPASADLSECNHLFCSNCIKTYLTTNINNGKV